MPSAQSVEPEAGEPVVLKPGREKPVQQHHPWIFSGAVQRLPRDAEDGEIVDVYGSNSRWLARGYLNRASQIQVRLLTWDVTQPIDEAFWR